jgi:hypothetical protein
LREAGLDLHAQLVFGRPWQGAAFGGKVGHGAELPDGANGGDDVERVAPDPILLGRDDLNPGESNAVR